MIGAGAGACGAATGSGATPNGAICGNPFTSTPVGAGGIGGKAPKSGIAGGIGKSKPGMLFSGFVIAGSIGAIGWLGAGATGLFN